MKSKINNIYKSVNLKASFPAETASLAGYCLLAVVLTFPMIFNLNEYYEFQDPGHLDILIQFWDFWWFKKAIIDLNVNPMFCDYIFYPNGASLVFQAHTPVYSLLSIPLQLIYGKSGIFLSYNIFVLLSFILCGWGTSLLANYLFKNRWAAFLSGTLFTLCGIRLFNVSRLHVLSMEFIPFALLYLLKTLEEKSFKNVLALSLFLALIFYNSFTSFLTAVLTGGCFLLSQMIQKKKAMFSMAVFKRLCLSALFFLILTAPLSLMTVKDYFSENSSLYRNMVEAKDYSLDLASLFIPTEFDSIYGGVFKKTHFGKWDYSFSYFLGFAWLFLILTAFLRADNEKTFMLWFSGIILLLFSLGPCLTVFGFSTGIKLPSFFCYKYLSFFKICGVPFRIVAGVYLCLSLLAGHGAKILLSKKNRGINKIIFPVLLTLIIIEGIDTFPVLQKNMPGFYQGNDQKLFYEKIARDRQNYAVLDLPVADGLDRIYMLYQIYHEKKIICACLRRSDCNSYKFLDFLPLYSKTRKIGHDNTKVTPPSSEEIFLNLKALKKNNIKLVVLHKISLDSIPFQNTARFRNYKKILEQYKPVKTLVLDDCIVYQYW